MSTAVLSKNKWPFSPQTIPTLALWLDAADTSSLVLSGSSVTTWKDKSGNGQNASTYSGTITQTTLNGNNALNLGTSVMSSPSFVWNSSFTHFFVGQVASGGYIISTQNPGVAYGDYIYTANGTLLNVNNYSTNSPIIQLTDSAYSLGTTVVPYNQWFIFCIGYNSTGTSAVNYTINGITHSTSVYAGSGGSVLNQALNLYINGSPSGSLATGTLLGEIIHFNSSITTLQRQQVEGYLAQKWGLQISLPITHPYYSQMLFNPTSISGCQLWLDAYDLSTLFQNTAGTTRVTAAGQQIQFWADKSGNNRNATSSDTAMTYNTTGIGVPSIYFSGSQTNGFRTNVSVTDSTYFYVLNMVQTSGIYVFSGHQGTTHLKQNYTNGSLLVMDYSGIFGFYGTVGMNTNTIVTRQDTSSSGLLAGWQNGASIGSKSMGVTGETFTQLSLGVDYPSGYAGILYMSEVIVYNSVLSTSQRQQVEGYLAYKWGLQSSLPSTHPYYSFVGTIFPKKSLYSRPFQPVDITGCQFWLDAADTTSLVLSGTSVTTWKDKSGNAYNATGGVSPTYVSNSQNGIGIVSFNGANNYLLSSLTINAASHTMFIVHNPTYVNTSDKNNDTSILRFQNTLGFIVFPYNNGARYGYINSFGPSGIFGQLPEGDVAGVYNIIDAVIASGSQQTYRNGSLVASYNATLNSTSSDTLSLGAFGVSPYQQQYYGGSVAEIIIYDSPLTTSQRQQVESYLAWKWGLRSILPSTSSGYLLPSYAVMFTPKSISGLQLWLDAADTSTVLLSSGTNVSTWIDKSGYGNNMLLSAGTVTYVNSNTINFQSGGILQTSNYITITSGLSFIFIVCQATALSYSFGYALACSDIAGGDTSIRFVSSTTSLGNGNSNDIGYPSGYFVNGVLTGGSPVSIPSGYNIIGVLVNNSGSTRISLSSSFYSRYFVGNIQEVIIFNSLTTSQRQQVEGYLAWKWGIQSSLPSTHAFAKISP